MLRVFGPAIYNGLVDAVLDLPDEPATMALAARIGGVAEPGDVIALTGELGTGKTSFARAFIRARDGGAGEVPSPTFTLVQVYDTPAAVIWHFDLYRLEAPDDAWELGIEEAFADGISLIEWPERLGPLLPPGHLRIALQIGARPGSRRAILHAGPVWEARLGGLALDA